MSESTFKPIAASSTSPTQNQKRKEVKVKVPIIVLGIHSNVPETADLTAGHAWISVSIEGQPPTNYGLWPDDHPVIQDNGWADETKSDIRVGMEDVAEKVASRYYRLSPDQHSILRAKLKENVTWGYTNTCAAWASEVVLAVTREDVDVDDLLGAETPRELTESIKLLEQKQPTSRERPREPSAKKGSSSY